MEVFRKWAEVAGIEEPRIYQHLDFNLVRTFTKINNKYVMYSFAAKSSARCPMQYTIKPPLNTGQLGSVR